VPVTCDGEAFRRERFGSAEDAASRVAPRRPGVPDAPEDAEHARGLRVVDGVGRRGGDGVVGHVPAEGPRGHGKIRRGLADGQRQRVALLERRAGRAHGPRGQRVLARPHRARDVRRREPKGTISRFPRKCRDADKKRVVGLREVEEDALDGLHELRDVVRRRERLAEVEGRGDGLERRRAVRRGRRRPREVLEHGPGRAEVRRAPVVGEAAGKARAARYRDRGPVERRRVEREAPDRRGARDGADDGRRVLGAEPRRQHAAVGAADGHEGHVADLGPERVDDHGVVRQGLLDGRVGQAVAEPGALGHGPALVAVLGPDEQRAELRARLPHEARVVDVFLDGRLVARVEPDHARRRALDEAVVEAEPLAEAGGIRADGEVVQRLVEHAPGAVLRRRQRDLGAQRRARRRDLRRAAVEGRDAGVRRGREGGEEPGGEHLVQALDGARG